MGNDNKKFNQAEYQDTYNKEHYDRIDYRMKKGQKEIVKAAADKEGQSINEFITDAVMAWIADH